MRAAREAAPQKTEEEREAEHKRQEAVAESIAMYVLVVIHGGCGGERCSPPESGYAVQDINDFGQTVSDLFSFSAVLSHSFHLSVTRPRKLNELHSENVTRMAVVEEVAADLFLLVNGSKQHVFSLHKGY